MWRAALLHILIRRNLYQTSIRIAAIDRAQRAAGALLGHRAFLDLDATRLEMRDDLLRRARGEEAEVVAPCGLVIGGEPFHLVGVARPHIDLLVAEQQRRARRL